MTHSYRASRNPFEDHQPVEVALSPESLEIVDRLNAYYGIAVTLPGEPIEICFVHDQYLTLVGGQPATAETADSYLALFSREFGLYPRSLVRQMSFKRVVLCGELFRSQKPNPRATKRSASWIEWDTAPLYFTREPAGGLPDVANGLLYLPIEGWNDDPGDARQTIHHEFYHCIQWRQFGVKSDPEWESINSRDFVYGPGGIGAIYDPDSDFWIKPAEEWGHGFLNQYSMSAPEEDQAELFAHLVIEPARVEARLAVDDILRRKVQRLKATLRQFCRDMDDRFWQRVSESRLPFEF